MVLVGCVGVVGGFFLLHRASPDGSDPEVARGPFSTADGPAVSADPVESAAPEPTGPQASDQAAAEINDFDQVCEDDVYFPQAPKRAGKAPHPVALLIDDGDGLRRQDDLYYFDVGLSKSVERIWAPDDPGKVQLVGCLDRTGVGSKIRSCRFDDPKPETVTLLRSAWRLRVYETATGRKLLDRKMPGDDQKCPYVALVGADKKLYAQVSDHAKVAALRGLVMR